MAVICRTIRHLRTSHTCEHPFPVFLYIKVESLLGYGSHVFRRILFRCHPSCLDKRTVSRKKHCKSCRMTCIFIDDLIIELIGRSINTSKILRRRYGFSDYCEISRIEITRFLCRKATAYDKSGNKQTYLFHKRSILEDKVKHSALIKVLCSTHNDRKMLRFVSDLTETQDGKIRL